MKGDKFVCGLCGETGEAKTDFTPGYGKVPEGGWRGLQGGMILCYACIAKLERAEMLDTKRMALYDCDNEVTNWPGSLRFRVAYRSKGRHNIAGNRYDLWFTGPDGRPWWGVRYGDNTQIVHCREIKTSSVM